MPYSINSYSNVGGSPFQQYMDQQRQQYQAYQQSLQQQQNQGQQGQQNPPFGGQNQPIPGFQGNQQNYGGYPQPGAFQYNPLPTYGMQNQQPSNQGNSQQRGWGGSFGGIESPNTIIGQYNAPNPTQAGTGFWKGPPTGTLRGDTIDMGQGIAPYQPPPGSTRPPQQYTNPYAVNPSNQPYSPFQNYGMFGGGPSGGTGNFDYSMFNYY